MVSPLSGDHTQDFTKQIKGLEKQIKGLEKSLNTALTQSGDKKAASLQSVWGNLEIMNQSIGEKGLSRQFFSNPLYIERVANLIGRVTQALDAHKPFSGQQNETNVDEAIAGSVGKPPTPKSPPGTPDSGISELSGEFQTYLEARSQVPAPIKVSATIKKAIENIPENSISVIQNPSLTVDKRMAKASRTDKERIDKLKAIWGPINGETINREEGEDLCAKLLESIKNPSDSGTSIISDNLKKDLSRANFSIYKKGIPESVELLTPSSSLNIERFEEAWKTLIPNRTASVKIGEVMMQGIYVSEMIKFANLRPGSFPMIPTASSEKPCFENIIYDKGKTVLIEQRTFIKTLALEAGPDREISVADRIASRYMRFNKETGDLVEDKIDLKDRFNPLGVFYYSSNPEQKRNIPKGEYAVAVKKLEKLCGWFGCQINDVQSYWENPPPKPTKEDDTSSIIAYYANRNLADGRLPMVDKKTAIVQIPSNGCDKVIERELESGKEFIFPELFNGDKVSIQQIRTVEGLNLVITRQG
ncbi:MAG: hypothetical protein WCG42_04720 [Parachlamydiaceae bacterium]